MRNEAVTLEVKGLDQLLKALKAKPPMARIGVLGDKTNRSAAPAAISHSSLMNRKTAKQGASQKKSTNAEIGAAHEFGAPARGLAQRSFLRVPLADYLGKEMEKQGALSKNETKDVVKTGSVLPWLGKIAVLAEGIVRGAFDTGGYGKWPAWKDPNYTNNAGQLLVDTTQLRDSITSEVKA